MCQCEIAAVRLISVSMSVWGEVSVSVSVSVMRLCENGRGCVWQKQHSGEDTPPHHSAPSDLVWVSECVRVCVW